MAPPVIREYLGKNVDYFAAVGAVATAYCVFKLLRSLWNGFSVFVLARALGLGVNLRRMGSWAGRVHVYQVGPTYSDLSHSFIPIAIHNESMTDSLSLTFFGLGIVLSYI